MKKYTLVKLCLLVACLGLVSCGNDNPSNNSLKEQPSWFSKEELANVHLQDLPAPTECDGLLIFLHRGLMMAIHFLSIAQVKK